VKTSTETANELNKTNVQVGLRINHAKTQSIKNAQCTTDRIPLYGGTILFISKYTKLGQTIPHDHTVDVGIRLRSNAAWLVLENIEDVLQKTKSIKVRAHLLNSTSLLVLNYERVVCALRENEKEKLLNIQRTMERQMLGIKLVQKIPSSVIRKRTKLKDVDIDALQRKLRWATHMAKRELTRWTNCTWF
jgi:hypothetical protein